jgi:hypothetical protein
VHEQARQEPVQARYSAVSRVLCRPSASYPLSDVRALSA